MRKAFIILLGLVPALGGCVASAVASAVGVAARSARGAPVSNEGQGAAAAAACTERARSYGTPRVIDVEQRARDRIVVWGAVVDATGQRSFECAYGSQVVGFKLRATAKR